MIIEKIPFSRIQQVWSKELWVGRSSPVESYSAMSFMGGTRHYADAEKVFLGGFIDDALVAVNSLHRTEPYLARSRGLWVEPEHRSKGLSVQMLEETCKHAVDMGAYAIWTFPRYSSFSSYSKAGFIQMSPWVDDGEFGPNCYAIKNLSG